MKAILYMLNSIRILACIFALLATPAHSADCSRPPDIKPNPPLQTACPDMIAGLKSAIWPTTDVPVCWEASADSYPEERNLVRTSIKNTWGKNSLLQFTGWESCTESSMGIRIGVADENPHTKGIGSQLRGKANGMILNFSFVDWSPVCLKTKDKCIRIIAVHEFGHAIGFTHEHNRIDTSPAVCSEEPQGTTGDVNITPWDLHSVMNYCNPEWSGDGKLSRYDIIGLQAWYGKPKQRCGRYQGQWVAKLKYTAPGCVADDITLNVSANNVITGKVVTPFGLEVPIKAAIDDQSRLIGLRFRFSDKDEVTLTGVLGKGRIHSTDCGCGEYKFVRP